MIQYGGLKTLTTANQAERITEENISTRHVYFHAVSGNAGSLFVGTFGVSTTRYVYEITPLGSFEWVDYLNVPSKMSGFYMIGTNAGDGIQWAYEALR